MSGTKFRLTCSSCNATFFDLDRRARYCLKCAKKKNLAAAKAPALERSPERPANPDGTRKPLLELRPPPITKVEKEKEKPRPLKATEATPEQIERIRQIYNEQLAGTEFAWKVAVSQISTELWLSRQAVSAQLRLLRYPKIENAPELKAQIIELYKGYVERGERPEGGRRKAICQRFNLPFAQVRDIVYEYSQARYTDSANPETTREQKFELEKSLHFEVEKARYRWVELHEKLAEQLPIFNSWQVARWMDMLFDDKPNVANAEDVAPEIEQQIVDAYKQYLTAPQPPESGLHRLIAEQIGGISKTQVHKVLQNYRNRLRDNYPLK
ncbi:MAG: hypothetical protein ACKVZH_00740 [Blastocatellia bacterium]